jgi:hypothetical protein
VTPSISARVDHASVGVGDAFVYTVEAHGAGVRVFADVGPFTVVGAPRLSRDGGVVRLQQTLACLDRGCAPGATTRRVSLPPARATGDDGSATARAPAIAVVPRVSAKAVAASRAPYRKQLDVPASSAHAGAVAALLLVVAAFLVAAAAYLVVRRPRRAVERRRPLTREDALRLLRESALRAPADRRRAADFAGRFAAHEEATRVAWAEPDPESHDVETLAERIEAGPR